MVIGMAPTSDRRAHVRGEDTIPLVASTEPSRSVDMTLVRGLASAPLALTDDACPVVRVFARRKLGEARQNADLPRFISVEIIRQYQSMSLKDASQQLVRNNSPWAILIRDHADVKVPAPAPECSSFLLLLRTESGASSRIC